MQVPEIEKQIGIGLYSTVTEGIKGQLRQEVEDFIVKEITNREEGKEGKYLILELVKRDWDTHHFTRTLAKILQISQKRISFAGTKDKRALTTQKISIFDIEASEIEKIHLKDVDLKVLGRSRKAVELGDLWGNDFIITIRNISSSSEDTEKLLIKTTDYIQNQSGVPNFLESSVSGLLVLLPIWLEKPLLKEILKKQPYFILLNLFRMSQRKQKKPANS